MDKIVFEQIVEKLHTWKPKGFRVLESGTQIIAHVTHVAPLAWFHEIYAPLSEEEIFELQETIPLEIPDPYKAFLRLANGVNVFSDVLSLYGMRDSFMRTGDAIYKPYNWRSHLRQMPDGAPKTWLLFGSYVSDGSLVFFDIGDSLNKVYRTDANVPKILNEWDSFEIFFESEVERLSLLFDKDGKQIDEDVPTTP